MRRPARAMTGLIKPSDLKQEMAEKERAEKKRFAALGDAAGRNAQTVF